MVSMKISVIALALSGLMLPIAASASQPLAQSKGCMTCHQVDKKILGPSFKQIAEKYKGDKAAEANLVKKVKAGGTGVWGSAVMPPNAHVKEEDIKTIVHWILTQ
jgi:cytochrome c